jgi:DNA-binding NarL/FixJ family response regulator
MQALLAGQTFFTQRASQLVLDGFTGKRPTGREGDSQMLTAREREILQLLAEGKISKEVAALFDLSIKTVQTHRTNRMRKLSCHFIGELVRYVVCNHLVEA